MTNQLNAKEVKEKIRKYLEEKGPELPVHVAKHMSMTTLFVSAFLSEMAGEGIIKISDMKVGGSPLYFTQGKTEMLENFTNYLGSKEREAFTLLKEKGILKDEEQHPAIRVALRGLKDFAFPFKNDNKVFWRYFLFSEDDVRAILEKEIQTKEKPKPKEKIAEAEMKVEEKKIEQKAEKIIEQQERKIRELEQINLELEQKRRELDKIKQELESKKEDRKQENAKNKEKGAKKKAPVKKKPKPIEDSFLKEIKPILELKQIELLNVEMFDKKEVFARIKIAGQEHFLAAYNKKKVADSDIIKAYKKASSLNLPYYILSKGETSKKTKEAFEAYKKLTSIDKMEEIEKPKQTADLPEQ